MKRGTFAIIITCILHIATEVCSTNILVTGRDYGETPALVTRGVFTLTRGNGVLADQHPGSSGLSPPLANGRLSTPRCTTLATQQRLRKNPCPHSFEGGNQGHSVLACSKHLDSKQGEQSTLHCAFAIANTCILHIVTEMCSTNILVTGTQVQVACHHQWLTGVCQHHDAQH